MLFQINVRTALLSGLSFNSNRLIMLVLSDQRCSFTNVRIALLSGRVLTQIDTPIQTKI